MKKILTQLSFLKIVYSSILLFFIVGTLVVPLVSFAQEPGTPPPAGPCTINKEKTRFVFPNISDENKHLNVMDYGWYRRTEKNLKKVAVLDIFADNCADQKVKAKIYSAVTNEPIDIYKDGAKEYLLSNKGTVRITYNIGEEQCEAPSADDFNENIEKLKRLITKYPEDLIKLAKETDPQYNEASRMQAYDYLDNLNSDVIKHMAQIVNYTVGGWNGDEEDGITATPVDVILHGGRILNINPLEDFLDSIVSVAVPAYGVFNYVFDSDYYMTTMPGNTNAKALANALNTLAMREQQLNGLLFKSDCEFYATVDTLNGSSFGASGFTSKSNPLQYQCFNDEEFSVAPFTNASSPLNNIDDTTCEDGDEYDEDNSVDTLHWSVKEITENLGGNEFDPDSPCLDTFGQPIPGCQELLAPIPGFGSTIDDNLSIGKYINRIFQMVMGFLGMLAVGKIIYGGIKYMTTDAV